MTKKKTLYGDVNVEEFYTETISGAGGAPKGLERDLITKFFGNGDFHGRGDHEVAFQNFRESMEKGEPIVGDDDGSGWIWAVAGLTVENGLTLELRKSTPLGMRALLVAKQDKVAEMFDTLNWKVVRRRMNEVLGHRDAEGVTMDSKPMDGATANGFGDMLQRLQVVEKRLDRIESGDVQGLPSTSIERLVKLEEQMMHSELQFGQFSGVVSGVKEGLLSQASQCSRIEEKLSSQLQALQANIQTCEARFTSMNQQLETLSQMVSGMAKERKLSDPGSSDPLDLQDMLVKLTSRVATLECSTKAEYRSGTAIVNEGLALKPQISELQATAQRLRTEVLEILARLEEQAVHLSSCRNRLDVLEGDPD